MTFRKYMPSGPPDDLDVVWVQVHGGLGDCLWAVGKKLRNLPEPVFVSISEENSSRPRRSGYLVDHIPGVVGWNWAGRTFAEGGQDWPDPAHPSCAIGKTWAELNFPRNVMTPLECNRHLEGGRRLEAWLPDVPTTHHFDFDPPGPTSIRLESPRVVIHQAGWPDGPDGMWDQAVDLFAGLATVYVAGGSYDVRPRRTYEAALRRGHAHVRPAEDLAWADLFELVRGAEYVFGHASGLTALADVLRAKGAVLNPRSVPRLAGTWNSPENPGLVQVSRDDDFLLALHAAHQTLARVPAATWPPSGIRGRRLAARADTPAAAVRAAVDNQPRRAMAFLAQGPAEGCAGLPREALGESFDRGQLVDEVFLVGYPAEAYVLAQRECARTTRKPAVSVGHPPWPAGRPHDAFDLVVLHLAGGPAAAAEACRSAWAQVGLSGTILAGGPDAEAGMEALCSRLRITPARVGNAPGWLYLHRA